MELKKSIGIIFTIILLGISQNTIAQIPTTQVLPDTTKISYNQISKTLNVFVYPSKDQTKNQQKGDEFECYKWAMEQSGVDPLDLPKVEVTKESGPTGGAVVGGTKGSLAGLAIGSISGNAGEGAAIGAIVGGLAGRRQARHAQEQRNQQAKAKATAMEEEAKKSFEKAFSVCMEGKGYTVN